MCLSHCRHLFHVRELNEGSLVRERPAWERPSVFARSVISTILCGTPLAARVCVVFLENEASRSRPFAFLHFLQPLSSETSFFDKPSKSNSWLEFWALFRKRPKPERGGGWRTESGKTQVIFEHLGRLFDSRCRSLGVFHDSVRHTPPRSGLGLFLKLDWIGLDLIGLD